MPPNFIKTEYSDEFANRYFVVASIDTAHAPDEQLTPLYGRSFN
jgi:hypothetical protein